MAASTNATRVFWGTAWTGATLLARELRAARAAEAQDGIRRAFVVTADDVMREVPNYRVFVTGMIERLGRNHPMVRTQLFCEELGEERGMFPETRRALMRGTHAARSLPEAGKIYAFLIDVGGEGFGGDRRRNLEARPMERATGERDSTALTIVEVDLGTLSDPLLRRPTYRVAQRRQWTGLAHARLYAAIRALAETWSPRHVVVDATGVGAGLASFLQAALPGRVIPFTFTRQSKSDLGWDYLALVDLGRWKENADWPEGASNDEGEHGQLGRSFARQLAYCQYCVQAGTERISWGVPDGTRDPQTGEEIHDDLLLSAALCSVLDAQDWALPAAALIVNAPDPLREMDRGF